MKLRIRGNSVRIRLTQTEMVQIVDEGFAQDSIDFGPGARLNYQVEVVPEGAVGARFDGDSVRVILPRAIVQRWQRPEEVSIHGEQALPDDRTLKILVEKDFECLSPRPDEDDGELFPNPATLAP